MKLPIEKKGKWEINPKIYFVLLVLKPPYYGWQNVFTSLWSYSVLSRRIGQRWDICNPISSNTNAI